MKNAKYAIIAFACICLICVVFYFVAESQVTEEEQLTDIEKVILMDLENDYPKKPREVVKLYNRIVEGYYGGEATDEQIEKLADQMMYLMDEDLLVKNDRETYHQSVRDEIKAYKQIDKVLLKTDVCDTNDVVYVTDRQEGTSKADELAFVEASYFVKTNGNFTNTNQKFLLRQDENGLWKILIFKVIEGESSEDE